MTIKIHRPDSGPSSAEVLCDAQGCETTAPPAAELIKAGGLIGLGWHCSGGKHFCPAHHPEQEESQCSK